LLLTGATTHTFRNIEIKVEVCNSLNGEDTEQMYSRQRNISIHQYLGCFQAIEIQNFKKYSKLIGRKNRLDTNLVYLSGLYNFIITLFVCFISSFDCLYLLDHF